MKEEHKILHYQPAAQWFAWFGLAPFLAFALSSKFVRLQLVATIPQGLSESTLFVF
jgi:hypothetical protein